MKFSDFVMAVPFAAIVSASPLEKREVGGLLLCTGPNATGPCKYGVYELDKCQPVEPPFFENTNTFAPDGDAGFVCSPRAVSCDEICTSPTGCTFGTVDFNYEHKFNLSAIQWDKLVKSFMCVKKKA